jgi:hypothetical protein
MLRSDNWDTMFMERLVGGHHHAQTTWVVLTLSNGFDFWAIRRGYIQAIFAQHDAAQERPVFIQ